jgi:hypothetical protein
VPRNVLEIANGCGGQRINADIFTAALENHIDLSALDSLAFWRQREMIRRSSVEDDHAFIARMGRNDP